MEAMEAALWLIKRVYFILTEPVFLELWVICHGAFLVITRSTCIRNSRGLPYNRNFVDQNKRAVEVTSTEMLLVYKPGQLARAN